MKKWFALALSICVVAGVMLNNVMAGEKGPEKSDNKECKEHKADKADKKSGKQDAAKPAAAAGFVETATGLKYEDTAVGIGKKAKSGRAVSVHYTGTLYPGGEKFDSSLDRGQPFEFDLGAGQVISGWDEGVVGMREGGKRVLLIPGNLAYGHRGIPGVIPPDATLKFEVELLEVR